METRHRRMYEMRLVIVSAYTIRLCGKPFHCQLYLVDGEIWNEHSPILARRFPRMLRFDQPNI